MGLVNFKYPKLLGLILVIILAYITFSNSTINTLISELGGLSYLGVFIAGILFAFGFTAPIAAGFFITLNPSNIWIAGIIGGVGALISDVAIFRFVRFSFMDEFSRLKKTKAIKRTDKFLKNLLGNRIKSYLLYFIAAVFIASPLPDEAGVIMLAGLTKIKLSTIVKWGFILNTIGIIILLAL